MNYILKLTGAKRHQMQPLLNNPSKCNHSFIIGQIYRLPRYNLDNFKRTFVKPLKALKDKQRFKVFGDFNIDYNELNNSIKVANYVNHVNNRGCTKLIDKPTCICKTTGTAIDHIYVNTSIRRLQKTLLQRFFNTIFLTTHRLLPKLKFILKSKKNLTDL